jgi:hypothetical protein
MPWQPRPREALKPGRMAPRYRVARALDRVTMRERIILAAGTSATTAAGVLSAVLS